VLLVLTGIGPMIPWRKASWRQLLHRFIAPLVGTAIAAVLLLWLTDAGTNPWAAVAVTACAFVIICIAGEFWRGTRVRHALGGVSWPMSVYELVARNRRRYGGYVVHLGIVVLIVGLTGSQAFASEQDIALHRGQTASVRGYEFTNLGYTNSSTPNVQETGVVLSESHNGSRIGTLNPTIGYYPASQQRLTEVALDSNALRDVYVVLVGVDSSGLARLSVYINPLVVWVWVGGLIMLIGGLIAVWPPPRTQRQEQTAAVPGAVQAS